MANLGLTKTFTATGAIPAYSLVKFGSNDGEVVAAAAATDKIIGVSTEIAAASGERCDVQVDDIAFVLLGGSVTRGDLLTSDANGAGVTAAPAAGANNRIIGIAMKSGASGDVIDVLIAPGSVQG